MILPDPTGLIAYGYLLLTLILIIIMGVAGIAHIIRGISVHTNPPEGCKSTFGKRAKWNATHHQRP